MTGPQTHPLQAIAWRSLTTTEHTENSCDIHREQIVKIADDLRTLNKKPEELLREIRKPHSIVRSNVDISRRSEIENLGRSSVRCQAELKKHPEYLEAYEQDFVDVMFAFFEEAAVQAENVCDAFSIAVSVRKICDESITTLNQYGQEIISDIKTKKEDVENAVLAAQVALEKANKAIEEANIAISTAKQAAEDASKASALAQSAGEAAKKAEASKNAVRKALKKATEDARGLLPNVLTILGIFVAIIFAIVACYLGIVLEEHSIAKSGVAYPKPLEYAKFLLMGHMALALVFLLLYLVSKFTPYSIASYCERFESKIPQKENEDVEIAPNTDAACDCSKCKHQCSGPRRLRLRYPYAVGFNFAFALGYGALWCWQLINVYFRDKVDDFINCILKWKYWEVGLIGLLLLAFTPAVLLLIIFRKGKVEKRKCWFRKKKS